MSKEPLSLPTIIRRLTLGMSVLLLVALISYEGALRVIVFPRQQAFADASAEKAAFARDTSKTQSAPVLIPVAGASTSSERGSLRSQFSIPTTLPEIKEGCSINSVLTNEGADNVLQVAPTYDDIQSVMDAGAVAVYHAAPNLDILGGHSSAVHCVNRKAQYFGWLHSLHVGDELALCGGARFTVISIRKVDPSNGDDLVAIPSTPTMRLFTCTPIGSSKHRLVVDAVPIVPNLPKL